MKFVRHGAWILLVVGCSGATESVTPNPQTPPTEQAPAPLVAPQVALPAPSVTPTIEPPAARVEVDLLHAVRTDLAVSSAYRDQRAQAAALVDGNLETAWNSRTGELVGASIEVRLPSDAHVTAIQLTAGFTHMQRDTDLFLGNHRVARVRVLREGVELGSYPLDVSVRTLQRLPLEGEGGVYRIEVMEVLQGSRTDWRETCISELQILGTAPNATAGTRLPSLTIGALGPPLVLAAPEREDVLRAHRQLVASIERQWVELEGNADQGREGSAPSGYWDMSANDIDRVRRTILQQVATYVAPIDEAEADRLRMLALRPLSHSWPDWQHLPLLREELVAIGHAMDRVSDWLNDDAARCRWARALGHLHLLRATSMTKAEREHSEIDDFETPVRGAGARVDSLMASAEMLEDIEQEWSRNTRGMATRLSRLRLPQGARAEPELAIVNAQIEVAQRTCGW